MNTSSSSTSRFSCATGEDADKPGNKDADNMAVVAMIKTIVGKHFLPGLGWVTLQWRWCGQATVCSVSKMQILVIR